MYSFFKRILFLIICSVTVYAGEVAPDQEAPVQVALVSSVDRIQGGSSFYVAIEFKISEGWDTYWKNPGDLGLPTRVDWELPSGFEVGELMWPFPERYISEGIIGYRYRDHVMLFAKVTPPEHLSDTEVELKAHVSWLACGEGCVPGENHLILRLPVGEGVVYDSTVLHALERLPEAISEKLVVHQQKQELILHVHGLDEVKEVTFIPEYNDIVDTNAQTWKQEKDRLAVRLQLVTSDIPTNIKGLLSITDRSGVTTAYDINHPVEVVQHRDAYFLWMTLCALLGGLILNAMPCVLPVLGLKIMGFVQAAHERKNLLILQGVTFTGGVLVSFWIVAGLLMILRASGEFVGWGFQLQEPLFVAAMVCVFAMLALSLFGLFEMGPGCCSLETKQKSPLLHSFLNGVLATVVATPCTGPLLGPALGLALTLSFGKAFIIFTCIGLGMASPYLLLSFFPKWIAKLPKPGQWMIYLKRGMGVILLISMGWLMWVFTVQTSIFAFIVLCITLTLLGVSAWIYGKWGQPVYSKKIRQYAKGIAILLVGSTLVGGYLGYKKTSSVQEVVRTTSSLWEPFSSDELVRYQQEGKAVFVDFTAKWCLLCQANKVTLYSAEVQQIFAEQGIITMTADWTKKDAAITQALEKTGRNGVPLYVLFPADPKRKPIILPQTLSIKTVKEAIRALDELD